MSVEAMKQALEALEIGWSPKYVNGVDAREKGMKAITSLRQAIAEAEKQEPAAEVTSETGADITMSWWHEPALPVGTKLYTQPKHEPLLVFAQECVLGAYRESELADAAQRAINAAERNR